MPPGVINMLPGRRARRLQGRAGPPRPGRHPLHRLHADLPAPVAHRRREHHVVPRLPADRRRDRRQGLHRRPPLRRPRRAAGGDDPRRVRVPGPEVLGGLARLRAEVGVGEDEGRASSPRSRPCRWATSPTSPTSWARSSTTGRSPSTRPRSPARSGTKHLTVLAGGQTDDSVGYFVRPTRGRPRPTPTDADLLHRVLRPDPRRARLRRQPLREGRRPDGERRAVRAHRRDHRPGPAARSPGRPSGCGSRPATSTSTTSPPVRSSASSRSAAAGPPAPTTRPAPRSTCCAGPRRARSRRPSCRPRTTATRTWAWAEPLVIPWHLGAVHPVEQGPDAGAGVRARSWCSGS